MAHLQPYVEQFYDAVLIFFLPSELAINLPQHIQTIAQDEWLQYLYGRERRQLQMEPEEEYREEKLMKAVSPLTFHVVSLEAGENKNTPEWHGTYHLTVTDQIWPEGIDQREQSLSLIHI